MNIQNENTFNNILILRYWRQREHYFILLLKPRRKLGRENILKQTYSPSRDVVCSSMGRVLWTVMISKNTCIRTKSMWYSNLDNDKIVQIQHNEQGFLTCLCYFITHFPKSKVKFRSIETRTFILIYYITSIYIYIGDGKYVLTCIDLWHSNTILYNSGRFNPLTILLIGFDQITQIIIFFAESSESFFEKN